MIVAVQGQPFDFRKEDVPFAFVMESYVPPRSPQAPQIFLLLYPLSDHFIFRMFSCLPMHISHQTKRTSLTCTRRGHYTRLSNDTPATSTTSLPLSTFSIPHHPSTSGNIDLSNHPSIPAITRHPPSPLFSSPPPKFKNRSISVPTTTSTFRPHPRQILSPSALGSRALKSSTTGPPQSPRGNTRVHSEMLRSKRSAVLFVDTEEMKGLFFPEQNGEDKENAIPGRMGNKALDNEDGITGRETVVCERDVLGLDLGFLVPFLDGRGSVVVP